MQLCGHGTDRQRHYWSRGPRAIDRRHRRSEPSAEAHSAGTDRSVVGGEAARPHGGRVSRPAVGAGSSGSRKRASTACCVTRRANPARRRCRRRRWRRYWRCRARNRRRKRPIGPAARSPGRLASPCARCNGSGKRTGCSRTASAPSSAPTTRHSPRRSRTSSASTWTRRRRLVLSIDEKAGSRRSTAPGPAAEARQVRHDDPRLQAQRHDDAVCRPRRARRQGCRPLHVAPPASGFHQVPQRLEPALPPGKVIHAILDNDATHKHPKVQGWLANHPGCSTSPPPRRPG